MPFIIIHTVFIDNHTHVAVYDMFISLFYRVLRLMMVSDLYRVSQLTHTVTGQLNCGLPTN